MQKTLDPRKLVFIDETWASTSMTRRYGRAPSSERLLGYAPGGHWKTTTFIAALRHDRLTAPWVLDGPINGDGFLAYVQQALVPTLSPGDIVMVKSYFCWKSGGGKRVLGWLRFAWHNQSFVEGEVLRVA